MLHRFHRSMKECVELLPPAANREGDDADRLMIQTAMQGLAVEAGRSSVSYEGVSNGLRWAAVTLEKLGAIASSPGSHDDACMGALRERILDCGVLPDLMTALAGIWRITSSDDLQELSKVASYITSALVDAIQA
ncbi:hypothetical protein FOA52_009967 [Chlamydomonas sp. UWO 241]|nr:hypothetical protein FOA52_009967 [Chlamydomonas sp. UWO 241]